MGGWRACFVCICSVSRIFSGVGHGWQKQEGEGRQDSKKPDRLLTLSELQSSFGDKPAKFQVICPQNGTAVLEELTPLVPQSRFGDKPG